MLNQNRLSWESHWMFVALLTDVASNAQVGVVGCGPQEIQLKLTLFNKANVQKNLQLTGELLRLLGLFRAKRYSDCGVQGPVSR